VFSIYQFGFKLFEDSKMWQEQITNLFEIEKVKYTEVLGFENPVLVTTFLTINTNNNKLEQFKDDILQLSEKLIIVDLMI